MKVWIVYDEKRLTLRNQYFANKLRDEFISLNVDASVVLTKEIKVRNDFPDIAIMRSSYKTYSKYLEKKGVYVANSYNVSNVCNDKWKTYIFLKNNLLPCMPTTLYKGGDNIELNFPFVMKSKYGHGGSQVYLINNQKEFDFYFKKNRNKSVILQKLADKKGVDKRIYILGNKPIKAIKRVSKDDFRSNYSLGGEAIVDKITDKEMSIVNKITNEMYFDLAGIDIIYNNNEPIVNEIEDVVGCRMLYAKTGIDIAKDYVEYLMNMVRTNKKYLENKFKELKEKNKNFVFLNGERKILISAPHAVEQTRDNKVKYAEPETALIALSLNMLGFPCIIKTTNENDDVNYDIQSAYKNKITQFCKENNIEFTLDLHQLSPNREINICLGTGSEEHINLNKKKYLLETITNLIDKSNFTYKINSPFAASDVRTISGYLRSLNYSALQIEINSRLISDYCNGKYFNEICNLITDIVLNIEKEIEAHENSIGK